MTFEKPPTHFGPPDIVGQVCSLQNSQTTP